MHLFNNIKLCSTQQVRFDDKWTVILHQQKTVSQRQVLIAESFNIVASLRVVWCCMFLYFVRGFAFTILTVKQTCSHNIGIPNTQYHFPLLNKSWFNNNRRKILFSSLDHKFAVNNAKLFLRQNYNNIFLLLLCNRKCTLMFFSWKLPIYL